MKLIWSMVGRLCQYYYQYKYRFMDKLIYKACSAKIFMFHHIVENESDANSSFQSTTQDFERFMIKMQVDGYKFLSIDEALKNIDNKQFTGYCTIGFDDGYEDFYLYAYPILKRLNIPFTIYIISNFIDTAGYMSTEQLERLSYDPLCTIGAHTMNHPCLRYSEDSFQEIFESKTSLEIKLNIPIEHFAYPYGSMFDCSMKNIRQAKKCGFKSAVSTIGACLNWVSARDKYYLPRLDGDNFCNGRSS
jgi:peptidoglycan/xylan/chitin deacetylase (PgdA/CDA1 family)